MSTPIIDVLTHISNHRDDVIGWGPKFTAEDLIRRMESPKTVLGEPAQVDRAVVFPALGDTVPTSHLTFHEQHDYVVKSVDKHPEHLIGGIAIHARLWSQQVADSIRDMVKNHHFGMLYIHPSLHKYWLPIQTPSEGEGSKKMLYPIFEIARELGVPILVHTGEQPYAMPATVDFVAGEFNDVPIIIGHLGTQGEMLTVEALLVAERHDNVYVETSYGMPHMIIEAVHTLGPTKVLFGSNTPPLETNQQLLNVEEALSLDPPIGMKLDDEGIQLILGGNAAGLLRL